MYEPTQTTYSATPDETLIAEAIEALPSAGERHHTIVHLEHQTVCLSVARAPAQDDCWLWFSGAAAERAELTSERLLPLVSAGNFDGWFYVAHDIGAAVPLSEYRRVAELSTARTLALLLGISHGLDDAVSQGKPPCEVSPDSVFLDPRLGAMIGDLGVAREALGNPPGESDAHAPWVAPEVLRGEDAHPRSAVYSFGAIAYTLLTGAAPHRGTTQEIAAAPPPRISEARPDLPHTLDTVFAVAMANDPRKRYATAAEARHLLNLVIYGAPNAPAVEASPRFRRKPSTRKTEEPPVRRPPTALAAPVEHPRRGKKVLVGALLATALVGGGVAGTVAAGGEEAPPAPRATATAAGMGVELPDGWRQQPAPAQRLEAHPVASPSSGLEVFAGAELPRAGERGQPVELGDHEAWRTRIVRDADGTRTVRYAIPTRSGAVTITCAAGPGAAPDMLELCERTASTLRLGSDSTVPLATIVNAERRWQRAARQFQRDRAAGRAALAQAQLQAPQLAAAQQLARAYDAAATRFAGLAGGDAVAAPARQAADAYRAMARAAHNDSRSAWAAAVADARSADARIAKAIAAAG